LVLNARSLERIRFDSNISPLILLIAIILLSYLPNKHNGGDQP